MEGAGASEQGCLLALPSSKRSASDPAFSPGIQSRPCLALSTHTAGPCLDARAGTWLILPRVPE